MKKYFAKYLPVEGEIKEEDKAFFSNGTLVEWQNGIGAELIKSLNLSTIKSAKLFLCSRDIQVGDKPVYMSDGGYHTVTGITQLMIDDNEVEKFQLFKVIGEVSLGAKWVKNDDEFDEEEVGVLYNFVGECSDEELYSIENFPKEVKKWYLGKIPNWFKWNTINIKCPCCDTFK